MTILAQAEAGTVSGWFLNLSCLMVMLIFVSDLHLVDHPSRESFQARPMFDAIRSRLMGFDTKTDTTTLVLLGDIFELLKSDVWLERMVRPWDTPGTTLNEAAMAVLRGIRDHAGNAEFFAGLQELRQDFDVKLIYMAGNHDALLADKAVVGLRTLLREMIPGLPGTGDAPFQATLVDEEHGVVAEHGHELDSFNRRKTKSGRFVPGDAVVIELLVGLPRRVCELRSSPDQFAKEFGFLHEMDNVEPQTLQGLMRWLEFRLKDDPDDQRSSWEDSVSAALRECLLHLQRAMRANGSYLWAGRVFQATAANWLFTKVSTLRAFASIPSTSGNEFRHVSKRLGMIAPSLKVWTTPPDIFVAGHTHAPLQKVFSTANGQEMTYLNTGTWRRVQSPVAKHGRIAFREAYHEALAFVHRRSLASENGRYELRRYVRGA